MEEPSPLVWLAVVEEEEVASSEAAVAAAEPVLSSGAEACLWWTLWPLLPQLLWLRQPVDPL